MWRRSPARNQSRTTFEVRLRSSYWIGYIHLGKISVHRKGNMFLGSLNSSRVDDDSGELSAKLSF